MKDKGVIWLSVGAVVFWLAVLFPETTGHVFHKSKEVAGVLVSPDSWRELFRR